MRHSNVADHMAFADIAREKWEFGAWPKFSEARLNLRTKDLISLKPELRSEITRHGGNGNPRPSNPGSKRK